MKNLNIRYIHLQTQFRRASVLLARFRRSEPYLSASDRAIGAEKFEELFAEIESAVDSLQKTIFSLETRP